MIRLFLVHLPGFIFRRSESIFRMISDSIFSPIFRLSLVSIYSILNAAIFSPI